MSNRWTNEQSLAINKQEGNILVSASAGSGKTAVLVERVIGKVIKYGVDIDTLLVVTFTNASAVELKERLLAAIYKNLEKDPKNIYLKRQINLLNRASITTIHAFCLNLIRTNFFNLDIDPNFKVCDETESLILKTKAIDSILNLKYVDGFEKEQINEEKEKDINEKDISVDISKMLELFSGKDDEFTSYILRMYSYIQSFDYPFIWLKKQIEKYNISDEKIETMDLIETDFGNEIYCNMEAQIKLLLTRAEELRDETAVTEGFEKFTIVLDKDIDILKNCINPSLRTWDNLYAKLRSDTLARAPIYKGENVNLKEKVASFRKDILKKSIDEIKINIYETSNCILRDNRVAYEYIVYLYEFLMLFDKEYKSLKNEKNLIDFNDIEHFALNLLIKIDENGNISLTDIAKAWREKFYEVYTDEYQDTSFIQEMILNAVSKEDNRFMVGDIKQSIYRFRQAMPEIFRRKYEEFDLVEGLEDFGSINGKIILAKNFRSRYHVIKGINYIFEQIMTKELGDADYLHGESLQFGAAYYPVEKGNDYSSEINIIDLKKEKIEALDEFADGEVESIENSGNNEDTKNVDFSEDSKESIAELDELCDFEIEASYVAKSIKETMENFKVFDGKKQEFRKCKYKDIVILVRNIKNRGNVLEKVLKENNIPAFSDAVSNLFEGDEIKLVMSFLKILDNPLQDIPMISIMYSIIGDFSLPELVYIRNHNKKMKLYENIKSLKNTLEKKNKEVKDDKNELTEKEKYILFKINKFIFLIEKFIQYSKKYSISEVLVRLYKETNIYYQFALEDLSKTRKANLDFLIDLTIRYESNSISSLSKYITYIDNLKEKTDTSNSAVKMLGENEDVVRIMTIHKSKGLEFPIVILCDTSKKYNLRDNNAPIITHHDLGIGINIIKEDLNISYPSVIKEAIKNLKTKETKAEELRMLYVAMTRAKEKLIVFGTSKDYEKQKNKQYIIYKGDIIDPAIVEKNNCYFDNIIMGLKKYDLDLETGKESDLFKINVIEHYKEIEKENEKQKEIELKEDEAKLDIIYNNSKNQEKSNEISFKNKSVNYLIDKLESDFDLKTDKVIKEINEFKEKIKQELDFKYKFLEDTITPQKVSVSKLKTEEIESFKIDYLSNENSNQNKNKTKKQNKNNEKDELKNNKFEKPECIKEKESDLSATKKGTLIHYILENLEYNLIKTQEQIDEYIKEMLDKKILIESDLEQIDSFKIYNFINSKIGIELRNSKGIYKEKDFILYEKSISNSIIQGIIDLYYINDNGNVVLVDFKTDNISSEAMFIKIYKKQLEVYKCAIEKLTKLNVEHTYIYSFNLDKEIEIKY